MIELKNLSKSYGKVKAVKNLNLMIQPGELFTFLGPNGAGKTTTVKMITGLILPTEGEIFIKGIELLADEVTCVNNGVKELVNIAPQYFKESIITHNVPEHVKNPGAIVENINIIEMIAKIIFFLFWNYRFNTNKK